MREYPIRRIVTTAVNGSASNPSRETVIDLAAITTRLDAKSGNKLRKIFSAN
jgi:hypothetical protein